MKKNPFRKVFDRANRRVRGLWIRNGSYYRQVTVIDPSTGLKKTTRIRLEKATNLDEARSEAVKLKDRIAEGQGVFGKQGPDFKGYREHYKKVMHKAPKTMSNEDHFLKQWEKFLGPEIGIGMITAQNVLAYRTHQLEKGNSARTVNLHVRALKQLLSLAKTEGHVINLATDGIKQLKIKPEERPLYSTDDLLLIGTEALRNHDRTGKQFADLILLLMFSGARITETLSLKWENVDWGNQQLVFPGSRSKGDTRRVDFNRNLKEHILCMKANADSDYLFPSCRTDKAVTSFKKILSEIRTDLVFNDFTFHLTRHFFVSQCVMQGIDYMTIAKWVGHKDGGILIGKIYGHLNSKHTAQMAQKLSF